MSERLMVVSMVQFMSVDQVFCTETARETAEAVHAVCRVYPMLSLWLCSGKDAAQCGH
jgi:hypothetical protein